MKKVLALNFLLIISVSGFSQLLEKKEYIYGTLVGQYSRERTGFFWFDSEITQMGQRIFFKEEKDAKKKEILYSGDFDIFISDSLYLKTFPVVTPKITAMIPRIVSGKLELYGCKLKKYYSFNTYIGSDYFFIDTSLEKIRIRKKTFEEQMKVLVGARTELMKRIENREFRYDDLPEIISLYNRSYSNTN